MIDFQKDKKQINNNLSKPTERPVFSQQLIRNLPQFALIKIEQNRLFFFAKMLNYIYNFKLVYSSIQIYLNKREDYNPLKF